MLGKALLGIAGAYLLRAVAESGSFPKLAVVVLAITYAGMWLVLAVRVRTMAWYTGITYATTSSLILTPMIWELTLRFKVLPSSISAAVLAMFAIATLTLTWKRNLISVFWVAFSTALLTALALMIATHDMVYFLGTILFLAMASEFTACQGHLLNGRILAGVIADIAVSSLIFIYSSPGNTRVEYSNIAPPLLLTLALLPFMIYSVSVTIRTVVLRHEITFFDIGQTLIASSLAIIGTTNFYRGNPSVAIGIICLALSIATYTSAFSRFNSASSSRNYHVYASLSVALFLVGSFYCLPHLGLSLWLGFAAITATLVGARRSSLALEYHGAIYLTAAVFVSGLLRFTSLSLIGSMPTTPTWILGAVFLYAVLCYLAGGNHLKDRWTRQIPHLITASLAISSGTALLVSALARSVAHIYPHRTSPLEFIQTLAICSVALALAYCGSRWRRIELTWIAYAMLLLIALKLLFVDLGHGHFVLIAASFFLYAGTLILLPRLAGSSLRNRGLIETGS